MDSEPVAWTWHYREQWHVTNDKCRAEFVAKDGDVAVLPLYRHPQPAPVVMDDRKLRALFDSWFASDCSFDLSQGASEADNIAWRESYWYVWKRCRAAMLAAAPHDTPALNSVQSVATVQGSWIPVSERMPEDEQEVLTINRIGHRFVSFFDKHSGLFFDRLDAPAACCIEHVLVTHWMPLPAGPKEVGDA
ncbi:Eaa1 [Klebsiella pneumoniae]|nr:Eaa1 [Klebsiella pneumoniae]